LTSVPPNDTRKRLESLSKRERDVLLRVCAGLEYKVIAEELHIALSTVKTNMGRVYVKLGIDGIPDAEKKKRLFDEFCPALKEKETSVGLSSDGEEKEVKAEPLEEDKDSKEEKEPVIDADVQDVKEVDEEKSSPPTFLRLRWMLFGLLLGGCLVSTIFIGTRLFPFQGLQDTAQPFQSPIVQTFEVTRLATVIHTQIVTEEIPVEITTTSVPTLTQVISPSTEAQEAPIPSPSPVSTSLSSGPSGDWGIRIYGSDAANVFLVNNHIVGATTSKYDWTGINGLMQQGIPNYLTVASLNRNYSANWGFSIRQNDVVVWGNEGKANNCKICYAQSVEILPNNAVSEVNLRDFEIQNLSGSWSAKVAAADYGVLMVNGVFAAGGYWGNDLGWTDISGLLYSNQDNIVTAAVWNDNGNFSWDFAIREGETVVWGASNSGSGQVGEVFFKTVIIDGSGNVVP